MKIKRGDNVIVISGSKADKGKTGKVLKILKDGNYILVEGIKLRNKLVRDAQGNKTFVKTEYPIHISNVMFFDPQEKKGTRIGYKVDAHGKKIRVAKRSGLELN